MMIAGPGIPRFFDCLQRLVFVRTHGDGGYIDIAIVHHHHTQIFLICGFTGFRESGNRTHWVDLRLDRRVGKPLYPAQRP